jgi:hypothetical protein
MLTLFPADSAAREEERLSQKAQSIGFPRVVVIPVWNLVLGALGFLFLLVWTAQLWPRLPGIWRSDNKFTVLLFVADRSLSSTRGCKICVTKFATARCWN